MRHAFLLVLALVALYVVAWAVLAAAEALDARPPVAVVLALAFFALGAGVVRSYLPPD